MRALLVSAFLLLSMPAYAAPQTQFSWRCDFPAVQACGPSGCTTTTPTKDKAVWAFLYPTGGNYYRCTGEGFENCDRYKARVSESGAYKLFELQSRAAFIKVAEDLTATEVVTILDTVLIKRGKCEDAPPPLIRSN